MAATRDVAGRRYAFAIAELARERDGFAAWADAIDGLEGLTASSAYVAALQGQSVDDARFEAIVRRVVPEIGPLQLNLFKLLRHKGRLALGPSIASYFRELWDVERGIERAMVRTAVELDDAKRAQITERIAQWTGKTVELETEVDPSLLGGMIIRIGDRLVDGSTRDRLRRLRQRLALGLAAGSPSA